MTLTVGNRSRSSITQRLSWTSPDVKPFWTRACARDDKLRREVESLLASQPSAEQFIETLEVTAKGMAQNRPESLVGQKIGSYQALALLGTGGIGKGLSKTRYAAKPR